MKKYRWEQEQISHMKEYIARFGHGSAKLARQAQSKEKTLAKMVRGGLTEKVQSDSVIRLTFTDVPKLPPPVLQFSDVTFGYSPRHILYSHVSLLAAAEHTWTPLIRRCFGSWCKSDGRSKSKRCWVGGLLDS